MKSLVVVEGALSGQIFPLSKSLLLGRDADCDLQLIDPAASRRHASVTDHEGDTVMVRDLASQNGTKVEGIRVVEQALSPGQSFSIGRARFEYRILDASELSLDQVEDILKVVNGIADAETREAQLGDGQMEALIAARDRARAAAKKSSD